MVAANVAEGDNNPMRLMRNAIATRWQYATKTEDELNQRDIQIYALASIAESLADIANALRDDEGNNVAHILHDMSFNIDVIASCVASNEARNETAAVLTDGSEPDMDMLSLDSPGAHAFTVGGNFAY